MIFGESSEERARLMVQMACERELVAMREAAIETDPELRERIYWRHLTDGRRGVELCVSSVARDDVPEGEEPECVATIGAVPAGLPSELLRRRRARPSPKESLALP